VYEVSGLLPHVRLPQANTPVAATDFTAAACGLSCNYAKAKALLKTAVAVTPAPVWDWSYADLDAWAAHYPSCADGLQSPIRIKADMVANDSLPLDATPAMPPGIPSSFSTPVTASPDAPAPGLALFFQPLGATNLTYDQHFLQLRASDAAKSKATLRGKRYQLVKGIFRSGRVRLS
jgi:hypothetical protein